MRIGIASMCCSSNISENLKIALKLIQDAKRAGARAIFFPEATDFIAESFSESMQLVKEKESKNFINSIQMQAKECEIMVSIGLHQQDDQQQDQLKLFNSHLLIDEKGEIMQVYRKLHLFDIDIPGKVSLMESKHTTAGKSFIKPIGTSIGNVGLSTCYDLRFPEQSLLLRKMGADILTYPSAFTVPTGTMHWKALLTARAIETQCFVIAAAQHGKHNQKRESYGHSLVVDPNGKILLDAPNETRVDVVDLDFDVLETIRTNMPVFQHRRDDIYRLELV